MMSFLFHGMKRVLNRKKYSALRLTAILLMISLICPGTAFATEESGGSERLLNEAVRSAGSKFTELYRVIWKKNLLDSELSTAISNAVDSQMKGEIFRGIYLFSKSQDQAVENIQNGVIYYFNESYERFLGELQESFGDAYTDLLVNYYKNELAEMIGRTQNPVSLGYLLAKKDRLIETDAAELKEKIKLSLDAKFPGLLIAKDGGLLILGLVTIACRDKLVNLAIERLGLSGVAAGIGGAVTGGALWLAGAVTAGYAVVDFAKTAKDAPAELKKTVEYHNNAYFYREAPEKLWATLINAVTEGFKLTAQELEVVRENGEKLANDPEVLRLTKDLSSEKKEECCRKLATILRGFDDSLDVQQFVKDFGAITLNTEVKHLPTLFEIIKENRTAAMEWFSLADPQEIIQMFSDLQPGIWKKFAPNKDSMGALRWINKNLSASQQSKTHDLDSADIRWLMTETEFHHKYLNQLFDNKHISPEIKSEIERLKEIPDVDKRIPWPSESESTIRWIVDCIKDMIIWVFKDWKRAAVAIGVLVALPFLAPIICSTVLPFIMTTLLWFLKLPLKLLKALFSRGKK